MSTKKILAVGINLASEDVTYCSFDTNISLLDWDIILFRPDISSFLSYADSYQGKHSLNDSSSFRLKERSEHWRREINDAVQSGKTVVIYLPDLLQVYVDSGNRTYSGTGRNQRTTRLVDLYDNYRCIPAVLGPVGAKGTSIKLSTKGADVIAGYWKEFAKDSNYEVILTAKDIPSCLLTQNGDKAVGAIYRSKSSNGALVLLPNIDFYADEFFEQGEDEGEDEPEWSDIAQQFAERLIGSIVSLDKALKSTGEVTPEPAWAKSPDYELDLERQVHAELLQLEVQLEKLQRSKEELIERLKSVGTIRDLLFEKGKQLEYAIIGALKLLGFTASPYKDSESEFDVVFEAAEGRLIGEAEGKDSKAINVDKLRQLVMNIHEDLQRESVDKPAKGVLFGNAYRLSPLGERQSSFTEKCLSAASTSSTALVSTPDLFQVAHYLSNTPDEGYATKCRLAMTIGVGLITFPLPPTSDDSENLIIASDER